MCRLPAVPELLASRAAEGRRADLEHTQDEQSPPRLQQLLKIQQHFGLPRTALVEKDAAPASAARLAKRKGPVSGDQVETAVLPLRPAESIDRFLLPRPAARQDRRQRTVR